MSELARMAHEVFDSLYDHCEELALSIQRTDCEGLTVDHPVYGLMRQFLTRVGDPETQGALKRQWDDFGITRSQHAPRLAVLAGVKLAKWVRSTFDPEELLDEINQAKNRSIWSIERTPSNWLRIFRQLNIELSVSTFDRRRKEGRYRQRDNGNSRSVSLRICDLPPEYRDSMKAHDEP